jgi:hypothetical protein
MAFYRLSNLERIGIAGSDSEQRPAIRGARLEMGAIAILPAQNIRIAIPGANRGGDQWKLGYRVAGETKIIGPGEAVYIPANVEHDNWSLDEEVEFLSCKNLL